MNFQQSFIFKKLYAMENFEKYPRIKYLWNIVKTILYSILLSITVFLILAALNWKLNPADWSGFSRFLGVIGIIFIFIYMHDTIKEDTQRFKTWMISRKRHKN